MRRNTIAEFVMADYGAIAAVVAAITQFSFFGTLLRSDTPTATVSALCSALFAVVVIVAVRHCTQRRKALLRAHRHRTFWFLTLLYIVLGIIVLIPVVHRLVYLYVPDWNPRPVRYRETGTIFGIAVASAQVLETGPLSVRMALDPTRTSLECIATRPSTRRLPQDALSVSQCEAYAVSAERAGYLLGESEPKLPEDRTSQIVEALGYIAKYRGSRDALLERGAGLIPLFSKDQWKSRLLPLLPTGTSEWAYLRKEYPRHELQLRRFIVEYVGLLDPLFHITFRNAGAETVRVAMVRYTAKAYPPKKASMIGNYETPRYRLEIEAGSHEEDLTPAVVVPSRGQAEIDLLIEPKVPRPGVGFMIELTFASDDDKYTASVPPFQVVFFKAAP